MSTSNSTVSYSYDTNNRLSTILSPSGTTYGFTYDSFGRTKTTKIGTGTALSTYAYDSKGLMTSLTYGNGVTVSYGYDVFNRQNTKYINDVLRYRYVYDGSSRLSEIFDLSLNRKTNYYYDLLGRVTNERVIDNSSHLILDELNIRYDDSKNRIAGYDIFVGNYSKSVDYVYGGENLAPDIVSGVKLNNNQLLTYGYDWLNRLSTRTINATSSPYVTQYTYLNGATTSQTTTLIETVKNGNDTLKYTYDNVGNIVKVEKNGTIVELYTYDSLGQLIEATVGDRIYAYGYDNGGNITSKTVHGEETFYEYNTNGEWKDLLTKYGEGEITYDAVGNPLTYYNGSTFTWSDGRRLTNVSNGTNSYSYQYDESGYRVSKTVNGNTTIYHWLDGRLQAEETDTYLLVYHYDENGSRVGFTYKTNASEATYYYIYNLQGDVIGIINSAGTVVVQYTYDPWGKITAITGTEANTIGALNPIRYRGYYYDTETGFYYCISRYYDPEICRFINADGYVSTGQGVISHNMFAYCGNNPVNRIDYTGTFWKSIGEFFSNAWKTVKTWAKKTFGVETSTTATKKKETPILPDPLPITVKTGTKTTIDITKQGDSSKPISVFANKDAKNPITSSSAGIKLNINDFTLEYRVGLDDMGISASMTDDNTIKQFGIKWNVTEFKVGFESSTAIQWDGITNTAYTNASINGWTIIAAYCLVTTGRYVSSPSHAYSN